MKTKSKNFPKEEAMRGYTALSIIAAVALVLAALFLGPILFPPGTGSATSATATPVPPADTAVPPTSVPPTPVPALPTPLVCTVTTPTHDPALVKAAIAKLNLPYVAGKPYPVVTPTDLLVYFSITGVDPASIVVDSDCTTLQLEPIASTTGFVSVSACNPTDRRYDGWRSANQATGTISDQQGFPTGKWLMEGISWAPKADNSAIVAVSGACN